MHDLIDKLRLLLARFLRFPLRVLTEFQAREGFLLSAAVAYYMLLSSVPMLALILVVLSQIMETQQLLASATDYIELVIPGKSDVVISQVEVFLRNWKFIGMTSLISLVFFSSLAFSSLERAMAVIFYHRHEIHSRHILVSAIIPFIYILIIALGLLLLNALNMALEAIDSSWFSNLEGMSSGLIGFFGVLAEIALFTSFFMVFPVGRSAFTHAVIGAVSATLLWNLVRMFLVWYFSTLSQVNLIYGSFASVIIILLSCEFAAIILLLSAQVIAVYEREQSEKAASEASEPGQPVSGK